MFRLLTRGDDAGCAVSANRAMSDAVEQGILRNISCLAPGPGIADAASRFKDLKGINIGLHTCLTAEWEHPLFHPLTPREKAPALYDERGAFHRDGGKLHAAEVPTEHVVAEWQAQLDHLRALGLAVVYCDAHMGVTWMYDYEEAIRAFARRNELIYRPDVDRLPKVEGDGGPDRVLAQLKAARPGGTYINVAHPVYPDEEIHAFRGVYKSGEECGRDRDAQRLEFMREDIVAWVRGNGVELIRYSDL
jgi:predicted glycoside hydrolase/deacetylase ChbG (UPF0249 family)